jgi:hypothetical protein
VHRLRHREIRVEGGGDKDRLPALAPPTAPLRADATLTLALGVSARHCPSRRSDLSHEHRVKDKEASIMTNYPATATATPVLGLPMTGTSQYSAYLPWLVEHLEEGRDLRLLNPADYPFQADTLEWINSSGLFSAQETKRLDAYAIPLSAAAWLHHDDPDVIDTTARIMTWISSMDDKVIEAGRNATPYLRTCPEVLRTGKLPPESDLYHHAIHDIHERIIAQGATAWLPLISDSLNGYLAGAHQEQVWRRAGTVPTMREYLNNRQRSIGIDPVRSALRLRDDVPAPGEPTSAAVDSLRWCAARLLAAENDIISAHKEEREGTDLTILRVLATHHRLETRQELLGAALAVTDALRDQHDQLLAAIQNDPAESPKARRYAELLGTLADNTLAWEFVASRYGITATA